MCAKYAVVFLEVICSGDITNVGTWKVLEKHLHKTANAIYRGHVLSSQCVKAQTQAYTKASH